MYYIFISFNSPIFQMFKNSSFAIIVLVLTNTCAVYNSINAMSVDKNPDSFVPFLIVPLGVK